MLGTLRGLPATLRQHSIKIKEKTNAKLNELKYGRLANKPAAPLAKQQQAKRSRSRNETNQTATKA